MFQISNNESFSLENYQSFFTDRIKQGVILEQKAVFDYFSADSNIIENQAGFINWYKNLFELNSFLQNLSFEEIFISPNEFWIKSNGNRLSFPHSYSKEDLNHLMLFLSLQNKKDWNYSHPFASFFSNVNNLSLRITLVHPSTNKSLEPRLFIRSIKKSLFPIKDFLIHPNQEDIIKTLIKDKKNILIAGSTGSGKTSFLSSSLKHTKKDEHLVILEDTYEIQYQRSYHSRFLSQNEERKTLKDFCSYALRMSPDRLILGEMRSNEVIPFLLAMNTGHSGLMSTIHASSARDAIKRVSLLFSLYNPGQSLSFDTIFKMCAQGVDYIIYLEDKKVKEIIKVLGSNKESLLFEIIS